MRILVTGREGQVARSLAERNPGHELLFAGRPAFDLADPATVQAAVENIRPDLIVSAAAYTAVDKAEDEPELAMVVNAEGPRALAVAAARIGAPVIHLSTDYVFDGNLDRPWREDDATAPLGAYGASKLAGEEAVAGSGVTYAIFRSAWVYSPFGANFVKTMLHVAEARDTINVVEDQVGCPTSALDIADALFTVVERWRIDPVHGANRIYHLAGTGETNWADFARAVFAASRIRSGPSAEVVGIPSSAWPTRARRPANSRLDCRLFRATFEHSTPRWEDALEPVVERLLANQC